MADREYVRDSKGRFGEGSGDDNPLAKWAKVREPRPQGAAKTMAKAKEPREPRKWTETQPAGLLKGGNTQSWQDHYDKDPTQGGKVIDPERRALHDALVEKFSGQAKPVGPGEQKMAILTMGGPACLVGETMVGVNRGGIGRQMRLDHVVNMFNGGTSGRWGKTKRWDVTIETFVSVRAEDGFQRLARLISARSSGVKVVYRVETESGHAVMATAEHRFLTVDGWKRLRQLGVNDQLFVESSQRGGATKKKRVFTVSVSGLRHHPFAGQHENGGRKRYRVARHRLVVEARISGIPYDEFIARLRAGEIDGLKFLDPKEFDVHHKDEDRRNNSSINLEAITHIDHMREHGVTSNWKNVLRQTKMSSIVSIRRIGQAMTFDLSIEEPHNFFANGIVVHNSGKSTMLADVDTSNFVHVDPDAIKENLPEYKMGVAANYKGTAAMVHEESSALAKEIRDKGIAEGKHLLIDGTGANGPKMVELIEKLKDQGYHTHVMMPHLDAATGLQRAKERAEAKGRYVPDHFIADAYSKIPGNFQKIAEAAHSYQVHDASKPGSPKVWGGGKAGEVHIDGEFVKGFKDKHFK